MTTLSHTAERPSSRIQVLEAIYSLYESEVDVTAEALVRYTGLKTVTVNDCIKELKERDDIWSLERGVYRPKLRHEKSRAITVTAMPDGMVKLEIGDLVINLTPRESQIMAPYFAWLNMQVAASAHNHASMWMADRLAKAERRIKALGDARKLDRAQQQEIENTEEKPQADPDQLRLEV